MLGKIEGGRRRGQQRMRWLDGFTDSMDMSLSKLWANLSLHLRGGRGYYDEKTGALSTEFMSRDVVSPAVDAGDPNSSYADERDCRQGWHGRRVNMGYYGNTAWATMTAFPGGAVYLR